ncbi:DUF433 domain-containing protein [Roseivivax sediminis]|uniref:Uncharacterized conserved protein, DUF433 family n=1 Tax=Roseivivax sediminis TaxID=936889 RepID=A0A1I1UAE6_9RHOB|nr:DUF433 domain-containing protein [Roseivivax sediminis]SFD67739.1 Uncharacterized conserved protein, DUF433 family [Roseivivax sediminis]
MNDLSPDPLFAGFFSVPETAKLVHAKSAAIRGWLNGYPNSQAGPVIDRDFKDTRTLSFLDLMEVRFVAFFRSQGVPMRTLRDAAARARADWCVSHPLALESEHYVTDRKKVFATVAAESGDRVTWDMASGQHEMWDTIEQTIQAGVVFDPKSFLATRWRPAPQQFPNIVIDPKIAFGKPVIEGIRIPTSVLFRQWQSERKAATVARLFKVETSDVETAVGYELRAA